MKKYLFLVSFVLFNLLLAAQTTEISGKITDSSNGEVLSQVNIQINGSQYGTITNKNGYFKLKIPQKYLNKDLVFSSIGYENKVATLSKGRKWFSISLIPFDTQIDEVIVMPDSTLLTFLAKAFKKIPENYPTKPTILRGFYRETRRTDKNQYLYFAEAVTESYKTGYQKGSNDGQVKIVKSLANEFSGHDTLSRVRFYGGAFHLILWILFIKKLPS